MILAASQGFTSYHFIMGLSIVVILSYFFNLISHRFNIPSVILLIALGIGVEMGMEQIGLSLSDAQQFIFLEIMGVVGLIMIVLEAALDLKLQRKKKAILIRSFFVALLILVISSTAIAYLFTYMLSMPLQLGLIYAIPLSIMSSAIIIPSVANLIPDKREFMIYESTFSDILGIMAFYMLLQSIESSDLGVGAWKITQDLTLSTLLTAAISIVFSYLMVILFQNIKGHGKLVLMVCILMLLYAVGKINQLSPLLLILMFGLVLNNKEVFFQGPLKKFNKDDGGLSKVLLDEFKIVTIEASFFIRTVFFVLFGMSIKLNTLTDPLVLAITGMVLLVLYVVRYVNLKVVTRTSVYPELYIAPRGLITILLFYAIPKEFQFLDFKTGILLLTIISTSLIMMLSLIFTGKGNTVDEVEDMILESNTNTGENVVGKEIPSAPSSSPVIDIEPVKKNE